MKTVKHSALRGCLCAAGSEFLYGLSYIFTKRAADGASGPALLGWRFLTAAAAMGLCVLFGIVRIDLRGRPLRPLLAAALFSPCIYFIGETAGIRLTTASESGVFLSCIPAVSLTASALILKKKPPERPSSSRASILPISG